MERRYISKVKPLSQYILQVDFVSDSCLLLDMKPYLEKFRFHSLVGLQTWNSVVTSASLALKTLFPALSCESIFFH